MRPLPRRSRNPQSHVFAAYVTVFKWPAKGGFCGQRSGSVLFNIWPWSDPSRITVDGVTDGWQPGRGWGELKSDLTSLQSTGGHKARGCYHKNINSLESPTCVRNTNKSRVGKKYCEPEDRRRRSKGWNVACPLDCREVCEQTKNTELGCETNSFMILTESVFFVLHPRASRIFQASRCWKHRTSLRKRQKRH